MEDDDIYYSLHNTTSFFFFCVKRQRTGSTLFPYTTLFRSVSWVETGLVVAMADPDPTAEAATGAGQDKSAPVAASADRKSTRLNSSHQIISYAVFCLKKKMYTDDSDHIYPYLYTDSNGLHS